MVLNMMNLRHQKTLKLDEKLERSNYEIRILLDPVRFNLSRKPRRKRKFVEKENETLQNWMTKIRYTF